MSKQWTICINQNGGEYVGWVIITANNVLQTNKVTILADGVSIEFDEVILEIIPRRLETI